MFRVRVRITFTQSKPFISGGVSTPRSSKLIYDFVHEFSCKSSWSDLTDSGEITLPKNVVVKDQSGKRIQLGGANINLGGFSTTAPIFMRSDAVLIEWGYAYFNKQGTEFSAMTKVFSGFIAQVLAKKPVVLKVEDNMFVLKQTQAAGFGGRKFFSGKTYTAEKIFKELFQAANLPYTVNALTQTSVGDITIQNETIAELLSRFQKDFHFESYFNDNELRIGSWAYISSDAFMAGVSTFDFQKNIIGDTLEYQRKDDIIMSAVCSNTVEQETGETTNDGSKKTKKVKLEVLITFQNASATPTYFVPTKTSKIPPSVGGERRQFYFYGVTSIDELKRRGTDQLRKYFYTGFKGKFTTFGLPFVKFGYNINLIDRILPERCGQYKVKSVEYKGGVGGLRQEVEVEYLIGRIDVNGKFLGL